MTIKNKMKFEFAAIILATALLTTVSITPLNYADAQNATMPQAEDTMTAAMIKIKIDKFRSEHPVFASVLDKVTSMDASQTLKAIMGSHILERILDSHAQNILQNQTGPMQYEMGPMQNQTGSMQNQTGPMQNITSMP